MRPRTKRLFDPPPDEPGYDVIILAFAENLTPHIDQNGEYWKATMHPELIDMQEAAGSVEEMPVAIEHSMPRQFRFTLTSPEGALFLYILEESSDGSRNIRAADPSAPDIWVQCMDRQHWLAISTENGDHTEDAIALAYGEPFLLPPWTASISDFTITLNILVST